MDNMKKWNYVISGVVGALGLAVIALASKFPIKFGAGDPGAGFWPTMLGGMLILLAVILVFLNIKNSDKETVKPVILNKPANKRVYATMLLIIIFCAILYFLGFYIGAVCFIPCMMYLLEVRSPKTIGLTTIITVAAIYIIFTVLLKTQFPLPIFMR